MYLFSNLIKMKFILLIFVFLFLNVIVDGKCPPQKLIEPCECRLDERVIKGNQS